MLTRLPELSWINLSNVMAIMKNAKIFKSSERVHLKRAQSNTGSLERRKKTEDWLADWVTCSICGASLVLTHAARTMRMCVCLSRCVCLLCVCLHVLIMLTLSMHYLWWAAAAAGAFLPQLRKFLAYFRAHLHCFSFAVSTSITLGYNP